MIKKMEEQKRIKFYFGSLQINIELSFFFYVIECFLGYDLKESRC